MKYKLALVMSVLCAFSAWTEAKVKLPAILSDGMVLQRERPVKIWGNADKGENVVSIRPRACFSPSYNKVKSQTKHVWLLTLL